MNKLHHLTEQYSRLAHYRYFVLFWGLELLLGHLATSSAKSDVIFLLSNPISYKSDEILCLSHSGRQTTYDRCLRHGNQNRRLSHCKCASLITELGNSFWLFNFTSWATQFEQAYLIYPELYNFSIEFIWDTQLNIRNKQLNWTKDVGYSYSICIQKLFNQSSYGLLNLSIYTDYSNATD